MLAIDCGTHAVRSILFDIATSEAMPCAEEELPLIHRSPDAVEIDPWMVADRSVAVLRSAAERAQLDGRIIAMGITNMRETAFAWDRATLEPACDGVMWMSQQSHEIVERWRAEGLDPLLRERTGLQNHTFFFPSKVAWMLENVPRVRELNVSGKLAVGTLDSWLLSVFTSGRARATDVANGSRTMVMNLATTKWDEELCQLTGIPMSALPELLPPSSFKVSQTVVAAREDAGRMLELERENRELRRANAILRSASAFFAAERVTPPSDAHVHRREQARVRGRADL